MEAFWRRTLRGVIPRLRLHVVHVYVQHRSAHVTQIVRRPSLPAAQFELALSLGAAAAATRRAPAGLLRGHGPFRAFVLLLATEEMEDPQHWVAAPTVAAATIVPQAAENRAQADEGHLRTRWRANRTNRAHQNAELARTRIAPEHRHMAAADSAVTSVAPPPQTLQRQRSNHWPAFRRTTPQPQSTAPRTSI